LKTLPFKKSVKSTAHKLVLKAFSDFDCFGEIFHNVIIIVVSEIESLIIITIIIIIIIIKYTVLTWEPRQSRDQFVNVNPIEIRSHC